MTSFYKCSCFLQCYSWNYYQSSLFWIPVALEFLVFLLCFIVGPIMASYCCRKASSLFSPKHIFLPYHKHNNFIASTSFWYLFLRYSCSGLSYFYCTQWTYILFYIITSRCRQSEKLTYYHALEFYYVTKQEWIVYELNGIWLSTWRLRIITQLVNLRPGSSRLPDMTEDRIHFSIFEWIIVLIYSTMLIWRNNHACIKMVD